MDIGSWFKAHPATVGETYREHLVTASSFGCRMVLAGVACMLHGVFPFLFVRTGSRTVAALNQSMIAGRTARSVPDALRLDVLKT